MTLLYSLYRLNVYFHTTLYIACAAALNNVLCYLDVAGSPGVPYDPAVVSKMLGGAPHPHHQQAYAADLSSYGPMYAPYYKHQAHRPGPYAGGPAYRPSPYYYEYPASAAHPHLPR